METMQQLVLSRLERGENNLANIGTEIVSDLDP